MIPYLSVGYPSHGQQAGARDGGKGSQAAVSARPRGDSYARLIDVNQQEAHEYQIKIEQLQSKIADYESMTLDLERRLEDQALQCMKAENEAILIDKKWAMQFQEITKEVDGWKSRCKKEAEKAESLRNHLSRTERELYGILQKKHEILRGAGGGAVPSLGAAPAADCQMPVSHMFSSSSNEFEQNSQGRKPQKEIDKRAISSLNEFLGLK